MLASGTRAPIDPNHQDDVPHVFACSRKRQAMPLPKLSHPVCLQPPCASSCSLAWTDIVFRDRKDRPERVLCVGLASLARLTTPVVEKLTDSILTGWSTRVDGPLDVDFQLASRTFNAWLNVKVWLYAAHGSRAGMRAACLVDLKLIGGRAHIQ